MLDKPWINISLSLDGENMALKMVNGKAAGKTVQGGGIGIENVRRRLVLLYPDRHRLEIIAEQEMYIVNLTMELNRMETYEPTHI